MDLIFAILQLTWLFIIPSTSCLCHFCLASSGKSSTLKRNGYQMHVITFTTGMALQKGNTSSYIVELKTPHFELIPTLTLTALATGMHTSMNVFLIKRIQITI